MKHVQEALKHIGVPVMAGVWRATSSSQNPPEQYVVYSTTTTEAAFQDDYVYATRTFVYMNLWSDGDPSDTADAIREAARTLGPARAVDAAREAARMGYVTLAELAEIEGEVGAHA